MCQVPPWNPCGVSGTHRDCSGAALNSLSGHTVCSDGFPLCLNFLLSDGSSVFLHVLTSNVWKTHVLLSSLADSGILLQYEDT